MKSRFIRFLAGTTVLFTLTAISLSAFGAGFIGTEVAGGRVSSGQTELFGTSVNAGIEAGYQGQPTNSLAFEGGGQFIAGHQFSESTTSENFGILAENTKTMMTRLGIVYGATSGFQLRSGVAAGPEVTSYQLKSGSDNLHFSRIGVAYGADLGALYALSAASQLWFGARVRHSQTDVGTVTGNETFATVLLVNPDTGEGEAVNQSNGYQSFDLGTLHRNTTELVIGIRSSL